MRSLLSISMSVVLFFLPCTGRPQSQFAETTPPTFKSDEAKVCWSYFRVTVTKTEANTNLAVAACQKSIAKDDDVVSERVLAIALISGNEGLQLNRKEGVRLLSLAATNNLRGYAQDLPARLYLSLMLWNGDAWYNTDTYLAEPMSPSDRESVARRYFRMNNAKQFVFSISKMVGDPCQPVAKQMYDSMEKVRMPDYDPRRDGDSSVRYSPYGAPSQSLSPVAGALFLLGIVGLAAGASQAASSGVLSPCFDVGHYRYDYTKNPYTGCH